MTSSPSLDVSGGEAVRRSWLLAPLSDAAAIEEAWTQGADVVLLDLAELVADVDKPTARDAARQAVESVSRGGAEVFLLADREVLYADLKASVCRGLAGVVLRLESADEAGEVDRLMSQMEEERGLLPGALQMVPALETARGNFNAMEIAQASPRIWGLTLGRADLEMDLRPEPSEELHMMPHLMQRLITVANAAGAVPLGAWWRAPARGLLAGPKDTLEAARRGSAIGFRGSMCIRSSQVEALNLGYTPDPEHITEAEAVIRAWEQAERAGKAAAHLDGRTIDLPTVRAARGLIARAQACTARNDAKALAVELAKEESDTGGGP
jgi:citrate lyase subunit beta/citryl-CoA lyase